ncbi:hypothetical protein [Duganella sp. BuS-21]|uniref:hypothetical protein n=1 Tax=Duganella sp. BuS-21 TaxID=2943848 RepID=UPI0035A73467
MLELISGLLLQGHSAMQLKASKLIRKILQRPVVGKPHFAIVSSKTGKIPVF